MRRRTGPGPATWLVLSVLVIGAGILLWLVVGDDDVEARSADPPATSASPDASPTATASGWAPPVLVAPDDDVVDVVAPTAADVPGAVLDLVVERAPVVVTVAADSAAVVDAAAVLALDLHAPLLVVDDEAAPTGTATPSSPASPSPASSASASPSSASPSSASPSPSTASGLDPTATPAPAAPGPSDLLDDWDTTQVVAVGTPPATTATVHAIGVEVVAPSATPDAAGTPSESAGADDGRADVRLVPPDIVEAMRADAASADVAAPSGVVAVVRPRDDGGGGDDELDHALELVGGTTVAFTGDDPRADDDLRAGLADATTVLLAVPDDAWPEGPPRTTVEPDWVGLFRTAAHGPELVGGGQLLFPDRTFVASYGNPAGGALGVLGERDLDGSIAFTQELAADYEGLFGDSRVQPAFEIIATVASSEPEDGTYSRKDDLATITEWVDGATEAGLYVVLDLQPGREDFLTQARRLEDLLARPNVGLALDPEWRLADDQVHLEQIGSVTTEEVNEVSTWLAELVRDEVLPQKLLVLHGFRLSMLSDRQDLAFPAELATLLHVDGQGQQELKDETYAYLTAEGPDQLWWGWKNFFDEDSPTIRSPEDTAAIEPTPHFISYQ